MPRLANIISALVCAALLVTVPGVALAQTPNPPGPYVENSNPYLRIQMGQSGTGRVGTQDQPRAGRFGVWTIKGDPELDADENLPLILTANDDAPAGRLGYTTLRIDNGSIIYGDPNSGGWVTAPQPSDREGSSYIGLTGFYILSQYRTSAAKIFAQYRMVLIRDQVRFEVMLRNDDTLPHTVGLRHLADSTTNGFSDSSGYPWIPGLGIVRSETDLTTDIPAYFEMYDNPVSPQVAIRNTLRLQDATPPDRMAIGAWGTLVADDWLFTPVTVGTPADWAWALWWNPVTLQPGQTRTIITYYGMAAASSEWTSDTGSGARRQNPWCVSLQGPRALSIAFDSTKSAANMLAPNPFTVKAYVYNLARNYPLTNVSVTLSLPPGLELVTGDLTQRVLTIAPETEAAPFVWQVRATGEVSGELRYRVHAGGEPQFSQTVERTIVVPATSTTSFVSGWQMVSIPFKFTDPRLESALGFAADSYVAKRWDPALGRYLDATVISPGVAFWLNSTIARSFATLSADARPLSGIDAQRVPLAEGWNQFGSPFLYCVPWGKVKVFTIPQEPEMTIEEAAARGILRRTIYWYDVNTNDYQYSSDPETLLRPWQGYWIRALQACTLIMPPVEQIGGSISGDTRKRLAAGAVATSTAPATGGWRLQLVAKAGKASDSRGILGVDSRAAELYDTLDVERPPLLENYVAISFPHKDWGGNNGTYMSDIRRSTGGSETWDFTVASDQKDTDVVLTWPAVMDVPKSYSLKLVDVDGGVTKYMRTTSAYRYNSGDGGARRFKLVAEPGQPGRPLITGFSLSKTRAVGGATMSFNLSADGSTEVRIKNSSGGVIRNLAQGRAATRGINSLSWNYRDDGGRSVPVGSYLVEIVVVTPEGEVAKSIHPMMVGR